MIASFHVIRYRRPRLREGKPSDSVPGRRRWVGYSTGARFRPPPKPDFHRWAYLGIWEEEEALDRFLVDSPMSRRWTTEAAEAWHVRLQPGFTRGQLGGVNPFEEGIDKDLPDSPAAVITWARLRTRKVPTWLGALTDPAIDLERTPGMLAAIAGFPGKPFIDLMTFSVWKSIGDAMGYAYRRDAHRGAVKTARQEEIFAEDLIARFYPYGSSGTWHGADPLASVGRAAPSLGSGPGKQ